MIRIKVESDCEGEGKSVAVAMITQLFMRYGNEVKISTTAPGMLSKHFPYIVSMIGSKSSGLKFPNVQPFKDGIEVVENVDMGYDQVHVELRPEHSFTAKLRFHLIDLLSYGLRPKTPEGLKVIK